MVILQVYETGDGIQFPCKYTYIHCVCYIGCVCTYIHVYAMYMFIRASYTKILRDLSQASRSRIKCQVVVRVCQTVLASARRRIVCGGQPFDGRCQLYAVRFGRSRGPGRLTQYHRCCRGHAGYEYLTYSTHASFISRYTVHSEQHVLYYQYGFQLLQTHTTQQNK